MVLPSRQQSAMCSLVSCEEVSHITCIRMHSGAWRAITSQVPHMHSGAWKALPNSNRGQRPRLYSSKRSLCLEGSTPQDGLVFLPRIKRIGRISPVVTSVIRQKHNKPLAVDARCLLRAIDAAAARKSLSKLRHFQPAPPSPLQGLASIARR